MQLIAKQITKQYSDTVALPPVSLELNPKEFVLIKGRSGSGKSTMLSILGGMLPPSNGEVLVDGNSLYNLSESDRSKYRFNKIGFVFQQFHLIPYLSVIDNIRMAVSSIKYDELWIRAELEKLNLQGKEKRKPTELSVGEQQRVALLRALVRNPEILIADEPTGNLDDVNSTLILERMKEFQSTGNTVLMVSHGSDADTYADRIITL